MSNLPKQNNKKYSKFFKGRLQNKISNKGFILKKGLYAFKVLDCGFLKLSQLDACRKILNKQLKQICIFWINVSFTKSISKKPLEVRMGKGKGPVTSWIFCIKAGQNIFEFSTGASKKLLLPLLLKCSTRLPFKLKLILK